MTHPQSAVHRTILVVDIEGFGSRHRTNQHQIAARRGMYHVMERAFTAAGLTWEKCYHEDRGDGILLLAPPNQHKARFVESLPQQLTQQLHEYNNACTAEECIRLRMALHAGEIHMDTHGVTAASINLAFRLLDAPELKKALEDSPGALAIVASSWFFDEVIRHSRDASPEAYRAAPIQVKETTTTAWIYLPDSHLTTNSRQSLQFPGTTYSSATQIRTLPRDTTAFTGRVNEVARLIEAVQNLESEQVVAIHAIDGMAGIGKTTLAIHVAYLLADQFPNGQIFLRLHAHTPGQNPIEPVDALASLLSTVGIPARQMPTDVDARSAMWRNHLADKRILLILDDAASSQQVEPLLPATKDCLAMVTSRRRLTTLETKVTIPLDTLPPHEAETLFNKLSGRNFTSSEKSVVAKVTRMCGYLPLAISLLAGRLRHHSSWSITDLVRHLNAAHDRLGQISTEDVGVIAAFDLSYQNLPAYQQKFFRYLGLHPGTELDAYSAAALVNGRVSDARNNLDSLYNDHLLNEPTYSRYRMHDLVRMYSRSLVESDPADDRDNAIDRLIEYYEHTSAICDCFISEKITRYPRSEHPNSRSQKEQHATISVPSPRNRSEAWTWMRNESANLFICIEHAAKDGKHDRVIELTTTIAKYLENAGPWERAIVLHGFAIRAAEHMGDSQRVADSLHRIARIYHRMADYPTEIATLDQALTIYRSLDHHAGQVRTLIQLGRVLRQTDAYTESAKYYVEALTVARSLGDRFNEACALNELGIIRLVAGNYPAAIAAHQDALKIFHELSDRVGEADARNELGVARRMIGDYKSAIQLHAQALEVYKELNDGFHQALTLNNLGTVRRMNGDYQKAVDAHTEALSVARTLGDRIGQAIALNELGAAYRLAGDYQAASVANNKALELYRALGNRLGAAETLNQLGALLTVSGQPEQGKNHYAVALKIARDIHAPLEEARALEGQGRCNTIIGDLAEAEKNFVDAQEIYRRIRYERHNQAEGR